MRKDFDRWNKVKKAVNATDEDNRLYFHEGDIWWVHLGVNVGYEIDGKMLKTCRRPAAGYIPRARRPRL